MRIRVEPLLRPTRAEPFLAHLRNRVVVGFVVTADGRDADFDTEAVRRRAGHEVADFLVGVLGQPFDELFVLFGRNFLREGLGSILFISCSLSIICVYFRAEKL